MAGAPVQLHQRKKERQYYLSMAVMPPGGGGGRGSQDQAFVSALLICQAPAQGGVALSGLPAGACVLCQRSTVPAPGAADGPQEGVPGGAVPDSRA